MWLSSRAEDTEARISQLHGVVSSPTPLPWELTYIFLVVQHRRGHDERDQRCGVTHRGHQLRARLLRAARRADRRGHQRGELRCGAAPAAAPCSFAVLIAVLSGWRLGGQAWLIEARDAARVFEHGKSIGVESLLQRMQHSVASLPRWVCIFVTLSVALAGGPAFTNRGECCGIAFQSLRVSPAAAPLCSVSAHDSACLAIIKLQLICYKPVPKL